MPGKWRLYIRPRPTTGGSEGIVLAYCSSGRDGVSAVARVLGLESRECVGVLLICQIVCERVRQSRPSSYL